MQDGRMLDWVAADGTWQLWNYDPANTANVFQESGISGVLELIRNEHNLVRMPDGMMLGWVVAGDIVTWYLWNYDPANTTNVFNLHKYGIWSDKSAVWSDIKTGNTLIPIVEDGRALWLADNNKWHLVEYKPQNPDIFTKYSATFGQLMNIEPGCTLIPLGNNNILVFAANSDTWWWFTYDRAASGNDILVKQTGAPEQGEVSQAGASFLADMYPSPAHDGYAACSIFSRWENILLYNSFRDQKEWLSDLVRYSVIAELKSQADIAPVNGSLRD
jgi:hypothetical protein